CLITAPPNLCTLFPYTTLFRSKLAFCGFPGSAGCPSIGMIWIEKPSASSHSASRSMTPRLLMSYCAELQLTDGDPTSACSIGNTPGRFVGMDGSCALLELAFYARGIASQPRHCNWLDRPAPPIIARTFSAMNWTDHGATLRPPRRTRAGSPLAAG